MSLPHRSLSAVLLVFAMFSLSALADNTSQKPVIQEAVVQQADGSVHTVDVAKPKATFDASAGPAAMWIWNEGAATQKCFIRKQFEANSTSAVMIATCDNGMVVKINGKKVAASTEWGQPVTVEVQQALKKGINEITVDASNEGGVGGFVLKLELTSDNGSKTYVVTDRSWTIAKDEAFAEPYTVKVLGKMGIGPWRNVFAKPSGGGSDLLKSSVPRGVFQVKEGFQVELLYDVPKETQGSWVSIAFDGKGRLIASDQGDKGLFRITPAPIGSDQPTLVESLDLKMTSAHGLLWAFDSLYISVNGGPGSGLYRATDTDGDDQLDQVVKLKDIRGGGEHGPHALRLSPDGKSIYLIAGNHTDPPTDFDASRVPSNWSEDHLLPRQWDARGHAAGKLAPGGWIAKTDPKGKTWEIISTGYRNPYDFDISPEGELFAYDADMEWDLGSPWYRPTRIVHAVSGSEFGWRSGTGKWPTYYVDSLPPVVDIGPGSPVGVSFGTGAKFPEKYQKALYCCDWTFGTMYAVHLTPQGSTYVGTKEEFVSCTPLPLTDVAIGLDGAMYFTVGGRGAQSALYRVTYVGNEPTTPVSDNREPGAVERSVRKQLEALHETGKSSEQNLEFIWQHIGHDDRFIRYAARVALEFQKPAMWEQKVLAEGYPEMLITSTVALAHQGNKELKDAVLDRLLTIAFDQLDEFQKLEWLRATSLVFIRMGTPTFEQQRAVSQLLEPEFPSGLPMLDRELAGMLVYVNSTKVIDKTLQLMSADPAEQSAAKIPEVLSRNSGYGGTIATMLTNMPDLNQTHYAFVLRNMKYGWTLEQRRIYLDWFARASKKSGGASFGGFLTNIKNDFLANATDAERKALESSIAAAAPTEEELPKPKGPGKEWTLQELIELTQSGLSGRNFENGKLSYASSRCISCHRYLGEGGSTGPDLSSVAGRFSYKDLLESIIVPSKVVSDQYRASIVTTNTGKVYTGRILNDADGMITVLIDPVDATKIVTIAKSDVDEMLASPTSLMPAKLLNQLNQEEVLDLLGYLMSRGNPSDPVFTK
ncbi:MAG: c-type cytochrome [Planctomycetota bacterium]|nr:c-type cytochrome [Planctomycetota bacterium]MDA1161991.1 c-type cytochrome [Planctomycetota bacterium]